MRTRFRTPQRLFFPAQRRMRAIAVLGRALYHSWITTIVYWLDLAGVFEDVKSGVVVGDVEHPVALDEDIAGLNPLLARWTRIDHLLRRGWHIKRHLLRLKLIANVKDAHTCVLVGGEDQV